LTTFSGRAELISFHNVKEHKRESARESAQKLIINAKSLVSFSIGE
jgi:hypothetical protein